MLLIYLFGLTQFFLGYRKPAAFFTGIFKPGKFWLADMPRVKTRHAAVFTDIRLFKFHRITKVTVSVYCFAALFTGAKLFSHEPLLIRNVYLISNKYRPDIEKIKSHWYE